MGYIEETGACQYLRDARIAPIYEGTTGIQAADLVDRKLAVDQGAAMAELTKDMCSLEAELEDAQLAALRESLAAGVQALDQATQWLLQTFGQDRNSALAASGNYLMLAGYVCGGWQMARAARAAQAKLAAGEDAVFYGAKLATARFYTDQILPKADALLRAVKSGASTAVTLAEEQF
jgi:acyl-CoA dehydrogenase